MIFDTHCHYNLEPLSESWAQHLQNAQEHGVAKSVIVGTEVTTSELGIKIAESDQNFFAAVGIHPNHWDEVIGKESGRDENFLNAKIRTEIDQISALTSHAKVRAIGETGLDYFHMKRVINGSSSIDLSLQQLIIKTQQESFRQHILLAQKSQLPLIIHVRDIEENAYWDVLKILRETRDTQNTSPFILHCISGPLKYVQEAVEMGAYIGVAGNVTYKNSEHIRELVRSVPSEKILSETDAPFLPPQEFRGKTCEPWMIEKTVNFITTEFSISPEQLAANATQVFYNVG